MPTPAQKGAVHDVQEPAFAATLTLVYRAKETIVKPGLLTGAMTINASFVGLQIGDLVRYMFLSDASIRIVTFGTGHKPSGTLSTVASKKAERTFYFDGTDLLEDIEA